MKAVNILSAPSSTPLVWGESGFSLSHTESIKPNLRLLIWVWEENTTRGLLVSYPGTFAVPLQPNFAQGFVLSDDMLNGIPLPPPPCPPMCGIKTCQPLQETTSCYLQTTPSLLLFSQTLCDSMHSGTLPFHISYAPEKKKADILGFFAQCWQTELLQQLVLAGISAPSFAVLSACNFAAQSLGFNQSWKKSFE